MVFQNNVIAGAAGSGTAAYEIEQSIRFNQADSAFMYRNFSGAGNKKTATWSFWCKRADLADRQDVISFAQDVPFIFQADDTLYVATFGASSLITNRVFRDPSAWYHFVLTVDSTRAVASDRIRLYVNGQRETSFSTENYPSLNADANFYTGTPSSPYTAYSMQIGNIIGGSYYNGLYLAEIHFLDGISYGPEYFGETNSNGIWIPKEYDGSYGSNGFKIDGRDSADLGDDESGNGNDFTTSGLAAHDQVLDTPTNNFCTINSVYADVTGANNLTLSEGNLEVAGTSSAFDLKGMTFNVPKSGKWYMEYTIGGGYDGFGFCVVGQEATITPSGNGLGQLSVSQGGGIQYQGWRNGGSYTVSMGSAFTSGHIHQVAIDVDNGKFYYGIQNTYYAADGGTDGNPSAGTNHTSTFDFSGNDVVLMTAVTTDSNAEHWNFGQNGTFNGTVTAGGNSDGNGIGNFKYSVPTGYLALCSKNVGS